MEPLEQSNITELLHQIILGYNTSFFTTITVCSMSNKHYRAINTGWQVQSSHAVKLGSQSVTSFTHEDSRYS